MVAVAPDPGEVVAVLVYCRSMLLSSRYHTWNRGWVNKKGQNIFRLPSNYCCNKGLEVRLSLDLINPKLYCPCARISKAITIEQLVG